MNKLTDKEREDIVVSLLYGEQIFDIGDVTYKLITPSPKIKFLANKIYKDVTRENRFNDWLTDDQCLRILIANDLCTPEIDSNLKEINKRIEELKLNVYEAFFKQEKELNKVRKMLDMVRDKELEMTTTRHSLDYVTLRGYAEMVKRQYLIYSTLYYYDTDEPVWQNSEEVESSFMDMVISKALLSSISIGQIREISRTDPWRSYWGASGGEPFDKPVAHLNDEQRAAIMFSQMYENVAKHPEAPSETIINDDDVFDGWMIKQRKEADKDKKTKSFDHATGNRHEHAGEIYLPARTKEDIEKIDNMNDARGKIIKRQRANQIKRQGSVKESQLTDKKLDIMQQSREEFVQRVRGNKR